MYKHIAIGFDGSSGARKALDKAIQLKKLIPESKLSVIYVNEEVYENVAHAQPEGATIQGMSPIADGAYTRYMPPEIGAEFSGDQAPGSDRDYAKSMHYNIQQQLEAEHVEGDVLAIEGNPGKTITAFAEEQHIDLLIVGNSGKSGLQKFFVGSVSEKVLRDSPCTVMVVK